MKFYFRIYQNGKERIAAVCDKEIKGKTFKHNGVNINVKSKFYGDELFDQDEVLHELLNCNSINAFGREICDLLIDKKMVHPQSILWLKDGETQIGHVIVVK